MCGNEAMGSGDEGAAKISLFVLCIPFWGEPDLFAPEITLLTIVVIEGF